MLLAQLAVQDFQPGFFALELGHLVFWLLKEVPAGGIEAQLGVGKGEAATSLSHSNSGLHFAGAATRAFPISWQGLVFQQNILLYKNRARLKVFASSKDCPASGHIRNLYALFAASPLGFLCNLP